MPTNLNAGEVLALNVGSSTVKFAAYEAATMQLRFSQTVELGGAADENPLACLPPQIRLDALAAVGHRIVHGMHHAEPELVTPQLLDDLRRISPVDPEHLPREIAFIEAVRRLRPDLPQVACFDTAFHRDLPGVARALPIPRRFGAEMGVRRYGFHGLSYQFLMEELARAAGPEVAQGRLILAHLGGGASLAAVHRGRSVDTTMGFTPAGGVAMGSRSGDLDPGAAWFLLTAGGLSPAQFHHLVNHESGMRGISETTADMRELLKAEAASDFRAAEAVDFFCYQIRKAVGAFAAALGGLDALVFSGGVGEHSPVIRSRICDGLQFLDIDLEPAANSANAPVISAAARRVQVRVIPTNEELMIARHVCRLLKLNRL